MKKKIAIIGASNDRSKFGNKAVRIYKDYGWEVFPVHPKEVQIEGLRVFPSVEQLSGLDRVSIYLPPKLVPGVLEQVAKVKPSDVYLNPGAESPEAIKLGKSLGLNVIADCAIVAIGASPSEAPE